MGISGSGGGGGGASGGLAPAGAWASRARLRDALEPPRGRDTLRPLRPPGMFGCEGIDRLLGWRVYLIFEGVPNGVLERVVSDLTGWQKPLFHGGPRAVPWGTVPAGRGPGTVRGSIRKVRRPGVMHVPMCCGNGSVS